jgi:hypothetical protein
VLKVKKRDENNTLSVQLMPTKSMDGFDEIEAEIGSEEVKTEVDVKVRIIMSEEKRFTLSMKRPSNDKMRSFADDLGDLLNLSRYALSFFYKGDKVALNERLGDREIGGLSTDKDDSYLLCMKGGSEGPKAWKRFTKTDDPCR